MNFKIDRKVYWEIVWNALVLGCLEKWCARCSKLEAVSETSSVRVVPGSKSSGRLGSTSSVFEHHVANSRLGTWREIASTREEDRIGEGPPGVESCCIWLLGLGSWIAVGCFDWRAVGSADGANDVPGRGVSIPACETAGAPTLAPDSTTGDVVCSRISLSQATIALVLHCKDIN